MKLEAEAIDAQELMDWLAQIRAIVGQARDDEFAAGNDLVANYLKGEAEAYASIFVAIKNGQFGR